MSPPPFTGVGVALVTLFTDDGDLDEDATARHAARLAALGVRAVVVAGSTGEAAALSGEERVRLLRAVRAALPSSGDVAVVAGTGAPSARQAVALTRDAAEHGADAVLVLSPPGAADPRPYYDAVAKAAGPVPVLAYHFPRSSMPGIPVEVLPDLPVVGAKDSSGDAGRLLRTLATWHGHLYTGAASLLGLAGHAGCAGAIVALANAAPEACVAAFAGDAAAQLELARIELDAPPGFPTGIKALTARRFATPTAARMG